jgi:hypothetical protein
MQVTLVKNPAKRAQRKAKSNPRGGPGKSKTCGACGKTGHNRRTCPKAKGSRKTVRRTATRKTAAKRTVRKARSNPRGGPGKAKTCSKCGKKGHNARTCSKSKRTVRRNPSRKNPDVAQRLPVVGKSKTAKWFDGEMKMNAHGAQKWGSQKLTQKAVTTVGAFSGYGYGGTFTQMGQGMSENALLGSGAGIVTGLAGTTLSSWAVNKVFGEMLLKGHEGKHHTFANFTKGWRVGGYLGVGINTVTNLLTMHYGRSYGNLGSWSSLVNEMQGNPIHAMKKMVAKSSGAHRLAHVPSVANLLAAPGMYADGPEGPLQGFAFGQDVVTSQAGSAAHPADIYTDANGYYGDQNDQLGYIDVMGENRYSQDVGYVDVLGYPSGVGYPAEFAENQPLYG